MPKIKDILTSPFRFVRESISELRKVTWPTPRMAFGLAVLVAVVSIVFSVFISGVDLIFKKGMDQIPTGGTPTQTAPATQTQEGGPQ